MATLTSNGSFSSLSISGSGTKRGNITWTPPTLPDGASIQSITLTANLSVSMTRGSVTVTINGSTYKSSTSLSIDLGTSLTSSLSVSAKGSSFLAKGKVSISNIIYTVNYVILNKYNISASASSNGSISPSGEIEVYEGYSKTFSITPNTGYKIDDVLVDGTSVGAVTSYTFNNISGNHTISATFSIKTYTITSSSDSNGSISPSGNTTLNHGSSQTYTITPNIGYKVSDVKVDGTSVGAVTSYTFSNVTSNHTINVTFSILTYTITSSASTGGSISPSGNVSVNYNNNKSFTITPNEGYVIEDVLVDGISVGKVESYTFSNVKENHTISATFKILTFDIICSCGDNGSISPTSTVNYGTSKTITITPDIGYVVSDVLVDGISVGKVESYTFSNVKENHTISATFEIATYTITSTSNTGGSISPYGDITLNYGNSQTYNITVNEGYEIKDVKVDGVSIGKVNTYTFENIDNNHTISVTFKIKTYTISATNNTGGTISPNGETVVNHGSSQTYTITPDEGYYIYDVVVDEKSIGIVNTYTFDNVNNNHTINVKFKIKTYTITSSSDANGSISPSGNISIDYGTSKTFNFIPNDGYEVSDVKVDGISIGKIDSYTFENVKEAHTISVSFEILTYTITSTCGENGYISPKGDINCEYNTSQTFTIRAKVGYEISDVLVDGVSVGAVNTYTFDNINNNHTIHAIFTIKTHKITSSAGIGGIISPSGTISANDGDFKTFIISANDGYIIDEVLVDGINVGSITSFTFDNISTDHSIIVTFKQVYVISSNCSSNGIISELGDIILDLNSNKTFTFTPNEGCYIDDVLVDDVSVGKVDSYTFENISSNHTLYVKFKKTSFNIDVTITGYGGVTPSKITTIEYGDTVTYTFTDLKGYTLKEIYIDGEKIDKVDSYTFYNINSNHTLDVTFVKIYTINVSYDSGGILYLNTDLENRVEISNNQTITMLEDETISIEVVSNDGKMIEELVVNDSYIFNKNNINTFSISSYQIDCCNDNYNISCSFTKLKYTILTESKTSDFADVTYGTISPEMLVVDYDDTSEHIFTFTPINYKYAVDDIRLDNVSKGYGNSYSIKGVNKFTKLDVYFAKNKYRIDINVYTEGFDYPNTLGGSYTTSSDLNNIPLKDDVLIEFTPNTDYIIDRLVVDGEDINVPSDNTYTFENISDNHTIDVYYLLNKDYIDFNANASSNINVYPTNSSVEKYGSQYMLVSTESDDIDEIKFKDEQNNRCSIHKYNSDIFKWGNHTVKDGFGEGIISYRSDGKPPVLSTTKSKFGDKSLYFDNINNSLCMLKINTPALHSETFTISFWVNFDEYYNSSSESEKILELDNNIVIQPYNYNGTWLMSCWICNDVDNAAYGLMNYSLNLNTWYNITICRNIDNYYVFINGNKIHSETYSNMPKLSTLKLFVEEKENLTYYSQQPTGYLDEIMICDSCLYTSNFTVKTIPYKESELTGNYLVLHCNEEISVNTISYNNSIIDTMTYNGNLYTYNESTLFTNRNNIYIDNSIKKGCFDIDLKQDLNSFTIGFWYRKEADDGSSYSCLISISDETNNKNISLYNPHASWSSSNLVIVRYDGGYSGVTCNNAKFTVGEWHYITLCKIDTTLKLYIDGIYDSSITFNSSTINKLRFGSFDIGDINCSSSYGDIYVSSECIYNNSNITNYPYPTQPFNTLYYYEFINLCNNINVDVYGIPKGINPLYLKSNGSWISPKTYIKQDGTWVLQDDISGLFNENTKFAFKGHIT